MLARTRYLTSRASSHASCSAPTASTCSARHSRQLALALIRHSTCVVDQNADFPAEFLEVENRGKAAVWGVVPVVGVEPLLFREPSFTHEHLAQWRMGEVREADYAAVGDAHDFLQDANDIDDRLQGL